MSKDIDACLERTRDYKSYLVHSQIAAEKAQESDDVLSAVQYLARSQMLLVKALEVKEDRRRRKKRKLEELASKV